MKDGPDARGSFELMCFDISDLQRNSAPFTVLIVGHTVPSDILERVGLPLRDILFSARSLGLDCCADAADDPATTAAMAIAVAKYFAIFTIDVNPFKKANIVVLEKRRKGR